MADKTGATSESGPGHGHTPYINIETYGIMARLRDSEKLGHLKVRYEKDLGKHWTHD